MRKQYQLEAFELRQFNRLRPFVGEAFAFWRKVAEVRGLDPTTMITNGGMFTALPLGHGKHWCFPSQLKCRKKVAYVDS